MITVGRTGYGLLDGPGRSKSMLVDCPNCRCALPGNSRARFVNWRMELPPLDVTDADLLRRTAAGDTEAFSQLYERTSRVLFALARQILQNDTAAEDLLQDVYVQVWNRAGSFDESLGRPMTWL